MGHMLTNQQEEFLEHRLIHFTAKCWEWMGCLKKPHGSNQGGYSLGHHPDTKKRGSMHLWSYRTWKGPIPKGLQVDHVCRNRACVNPSHLEAVTPSENQRRAGALITHCPKGHEYDEANTKFKYGRRNCRACHREQERERRAKQSETP